MLKANQCVFVCVPDDHKTIGVDCEHLAAQIEEHILSCCNFSYTGYTRTNTTGFHTDANLSVVTGCGSLQLSAVWLREALVLMLSTVLQSEFYLVPPDVQSLHFSSKDTSETLCVLASSIKNTR